MLSNNLPAVLIALSTGLMIACLGPVNGAFEARTGLWPMLTLVHRLGLSLALLEWLARPSAATTLPALLPGQLLGLVLVALVLLGREALTLGAPPLALVGGALGLLGTVQAITQLGVLSALLLMILAELLGAALIDSLGLLGRPRLPLDPVRLGGLLLVVAGTVLTLRRAMSPCWSVWPLVTPQPTSVPASFIRRGGCSAFIWNAGSVQGCSTCLQWPV